MRLEVIEKIARVSHEINRVYCRSIGDDSQPTWEQAPEWQRDSAKEGVLKILNKQVRNPQESHQSWLAHKQLHGWVYGPEKNPDKKEHPCMVPYEELPAEQRLKDAFFWTTTIEVARALGLGDESE